MALVDRVADGLAHQMRPERPAAELVAVEHLR